MGNQQNNQRIRRITANMTRALACLGLVAGTTWTAFSLLHVNSLIAGFAYVLVVLVVAAKWGLAESFLTSVAAMLCLNYFFLQPILSLTIADPQNWVALFVFLVTAITASKLSSNARQRADEAQARRVEVERCFFRAPSGLRSNHEAFRLLPGACSSNSQRPTFAFPDE
jgi:K+-sensing histidine kinase KdpD